VPTSPEIPNRAANSFADVVMVLGDALVGCLIYVVRTRLPPQIWEELPLQYKSQAESWSWFEKAERY
jgi:hypothetical protein